MIPRQTRVLEAVGRAAHSSRSSTWITLGALIAFLLPAAGLSSSRSSDPSGPAAAVTITEPFADGTVLVGFEPGTSRAEEQAAAAAAGATYDGVIGDGTHVLRVPKGKVAEKVAQLKAHGKVRYAEPDYVVSTTMVPNDPGWNKLWGMPNIKADEAWNITTGSSNVVVGVVDTGIDYNHPDLAANVWTSEKVIGTCPAGSHGYNAITATCDPLDDHNHGTHVAGTIGGVGNNGIGVIGVDPKVKIMGLKFLNQNGSGQTSGAVAAIEWAIKAKLAGVNIRVLSNSWGGGGYSQALRDVIVKAGAYDILFVVAAGNSTKDVDATPLLSLQLQDCQRDLRGRVREPQGCPRGILQLRRRLGRPQRARESESSRL